MSKKQDLEAIERLQKINEFKRRYNEVQHEVEAIVREMMLDLDISLVEALRLLQDR